MKIDKCPCVNKSDADDIRSALTTAINIYRNIVKTSTIDVTSSESIALEEKANKFNILINQLDKITCKKEDKKIKEDKRIKEDEMKHITFEEIAKLPLKERIRIATAIAGTVSE